ncbi:MAG: hypothetical protein ACYC6W_10265 [Nitrosotalea sp.]
MKTLHLGIIAGIVVIAMMIISYEIVQNSVKNTKLGCTDPEQANLQYDAKRLATRQQVESIVMDDPTIKKIIDNSNYCEIMALGTLCSKNGSYQILSINLNNTKELSAQVSLQNSTVVSYQIENLTRTHPAL